MTRQFEILQRKTVFQRFIFKIDEIELRHEKHDGTMSAPITRLVFERGSSAAVLLHDPAADALLFCEQFRAPTCAHGSAWLIELPAGVVDPEEKPEAAAKRETLEETGQEVAHLQRIASVYPSPGGSSELVHIFYGQTPLSLGVPETAGLENEDEDIRVLCEPVSKAFSWVDAGEIQDAKTMIALQWLRHELRHKELA